MLTERELRNRELDLRTKLLNLTLEFRAWRKGRRVWVGRMPGAFEDELIELRAQLETVLADYAERLRESTASLRTAVDILERNTPARMPAQDVLELGECLARSEAITPLADAFPQPPANDLPAPGPVYQPAENLAARSFLEDMAKPSLGDGSLRPIRGKVLLFTGVRRSRVTPQDGGAA